VNRICQAADVKYPNRLTATAMRHRVSTLYAGIEMSETDRQLFYKHMGHSGAINEHVYQTPGAEAEILKVGSNLTAMDGQNIHGHSGTGAEAAVTMEGAVVEPITMETIVTDNFITTEASSLGTCQNIRASGSNTSGKSKSPVKQVKGENICS
jgi:hypothetical protein